MYPIQGKSFPKIHVSLSRSRYSKVQKGKKNWNVTQLKRNTLPGVSVFYAEYSASYSRKTGSNFLQPTVWLAMMVSVALWICLGSKLYLKRIYHDLDTTWYFDPHSTTVPNRDKMTSFLLYSSWGRDLGMKWLLCSPTVSYSTGVQSGNLGISSSIWGNLYIVACHLSKGS